MVRKLRSYFGDYFDTAVYWKPSWGEINADEPWLNRKFNLALLEQDILDDKDELYTNDRYETQND